MVFAIRRRTLPPLMAQIFIHLFTPPFFLLQLNLTYMKRILHLVSVKNVTFKSSYYWLLEQHLPLCFVLRNLFKQDWQFFPFLSHFPNYVTFCILHVGSTKFFSDVSSISSAQQNRRRASDIFLKSQSRLFSTMIAKKRKQEHVVSSEYL